MSKPTKNGIKLSDKTCKDFSDLVTGFAKHLKKNDIVEPCDKFMRYTSEGFNFNPKDYCVFCGKKHLEWKR